ncbi:hypothetical protein MD484_g6848, partial [Candolleomyces efflorescens]
MGKRKRNASISVGSSAGPRGVKRKHLNSEGKWTIAEPDSAQSTGKAFLSELPLDLFSEECSAEEGTTILEQCDPNFLRMELRARLCDGCYSARHTTWNDLPEKVNEELKPLVPNHQHSGEVVYDVETALKMGAQYNQLRSSAQKDDWLKDQSKIWEGVIKHSSLCQTFTEQELHKERPRLMQLQQKRREQVVQKLRALGWAKELDFIGGIRGFIDDWEARQAPLLDVPAELNDQGALLPG